MKFRTKIWLLPLSAAIVFVIGLTISVLVGSSTSNAMQQLRDVDAPYKEQVLFVDREVEQFQLTLQSAAAEGDITKLDEVQAIVKKTHESLDEIARIAGKNEQAQTLRAAFDAYQQPALTATRAMLSQGDVGDHIQKMQTAQASLQKLLKSTAENAEQATAARDAEAARGVRLGLWINVGTGLLVLTVLGVASVVIVRSVWRDLGQEPSALQAMMLEVAAGNLQVQPQVQAGDKHSMNATMAEMVARLRATVVQIRSVSESIALASGEIETGNHDLSSRTESAASSLQQTSASMEQLTDGVRHSAEAARRANDMAGTAAQAAQQGGQIVEGVMHSMDEINNSSRRIEEIIGVIDGIAFQTNILALNAAVEAARAGEQGRGFAVVAGEVRTLAQRSAQAAREIKDLIVASGEKVSSGSRQVQDTGAAMKEIVAGVQGLTAIIAEISGSTHEQSEGIVQVNSAIGQLDQMTQQNAALVEESAAAATSMREQAALLAQAVAAFRVGDASTGRSSYLALSEH